MHTCNPRFTKATIERLLCVQNQPGLHTQLQARLGYSVKQIRKHKQKGQRPIAARAEPKHKEMGERPGNSAGHVKGSILAIGMVSLGTDGVRREGLGGGEGRTRMGLGIRPGSRGKARGDSSRRGWRCRSYLSGANRRSCSLTLPQPASAGMLEAGAAKASQRPR